MSKFRLEHVQDPDFASGLSPVEYLNRLHGGIPMDRILSPCPFCGMRPEVISDCGTIQCRTTECPASRISRPLTADQYYQKWETRHKEEGVNKLSAVIAFRDGQPVLIEMSSEQTVTFEPLKGDHWRIEIIRKRG